MKPHEMKRRPLGKTGVMVSEVGFGAWALGGRMWGGADDKTSLAALFTALEQGVNLIDTALVYGDGRSERLIGEAVAARARRQEVCLCTKVPPKNRTWPARPNVPLADCF